MLIYVYIYYLYCQSVDNFIDAIQTMEINEDIYCKVCVDVGLVRRCTQTRCVVFLSCIGSHLMLYILKNICRRTGVFISSVRFSGLQVIFQHSPCEFCERLHTLRTIANCNTKLPVTNSFCIIIS